MRFIKFKFSEYRRRKLRKKIILAILQNPEHGANKNLEPVDDDGICPITGLSAQLELFIEDGIQPFLSRHSK